ncbi:hypothetical protein L1887_51523 [Cichorium endivia]|nr:hypothetical protein L1887_51523 [Cichorium endivia]
MNPCLNAQCFSRSPTVQNVRKLDRADSCPLPVRSEPAAPHTQTSVVGVDDVDELGLERGAADEEAVDVGLLGEFLAVLGGDGAAVDDAELLSRVLAELVGGPLADGGVHLLRLLRGSDLARADGPDGLVGDHDLGPVLNLVGGGVELTNDDVDRLVGLALLERLADAQDHREALGESGGGLLGDVGVRLAKERTALRVAEDDPGDRGVLEHVDRHLAREGTARLVVGVLRRDGHLGASKLLLDGQQSLKRRPVALTDVGVELGLGERLGELLGGLKRAVHLPVSADEESASHGCKVCLCELGGDGGGGGVCVGCEETSKERGRIGHMGDACQGAGWQLHLCGCARVRKNPNPTPSECCRGGEQEIPIKMCEISRDSAEKGPGGNIHLIASVPRSISHFCQQHFRVDFALPRQQA